MTQQSQFYLDRAKDIGLYQQEREIREFIEFLTTYSHTHIFHNVLEIGSQDGGSYYLWCKLSGSGGVKISIDLPNAPYSTRHLSGEDIMHRTELLSSFSPQSHVVLANSHDTSTKERVKDLLNGELLDFIFIDGDHTYEGVKADYELYRDLVGPGGLMCFHDICDSEWHRSVNCNVSTLWQEISHLYTHVTFGPYENWGGIGVITLP